MTGIVVGRCDVCGRERFPKPIWCASCGTDRIRESVVESGVVEEATTVRHATGRVLGAPVRLGSVRLPGGTIVIARLESGADEGNEVELSTVDGAPVARRHSS